MPQETVQEATRHGDTPQVVLIPVAPARLLPLAIVLTIACFWVGGFALVLGQRHPLGYVALLLPVLFVIMMARGILWHRAVHAKDALATTEGDQTHTNMLAEAIEAQVKREFKTFGGFHARSNGPLTRGTISAIESCYDAKPAPPHIVVYGNATPPQVAAYRFVPAVFRVLSWDRRFPVTSLVVGFIVLFAITCFLWALAPSLRGWLGRLHLRRALLVIFPAILILLASFRFWWTTVHQQFLRLSPGRLEVLKYKLRSEHPEVKSFPVEAGTTIILCHDGHSSDSLRRISIPIHAYSPCLILARGSKREYVSLRAIERLDDFMDTLWMATLSTAATPPLSEEELVG